jgi:hypothetical protein
LQGEGVVRAQVFLVYDLESGVLRLGDDAPRSGEFAVGKDVTVDEQPRAGRRPVVGPGDAVVQQPSAGAKFAAR